MITLGNTIFVESYPTLVFDQLLASVFKNDPSLSFYGTRYPLRLKKCTKGAIQWKIIKELLKCGVYLVTLFIQRIYTGCSKTTIKDLQDRE